MVYGMVLLEFLLGQGLLWVYEVRTEWHTTDLPGPLQVLIGLESVMDVQLVENKRPLASS